MAVVQFALLVRADAPEGLLVGRRVILYGNQGRHPTQGQRTSFMTGLAEQLGVAIHAVLRHVHREPVRHDPPGVQLQGLDHAENVIPAPAVETNHMIAQLVEDFVHLECSGQRLDEHRGLDAAAVNAQHVLGGNEQVIPQPRLQVGFELGQIEIRPRATIDQRPRVVEKVQREIDDGRRRRCTIHQDVFFEQMPATGSDD